MPEKALLIESLSQIHGATERILKRFEPIRSPDDFLEDEAGHEKLDAICMQLIAIGESLKNI
ncbi:MAG: antitoxin, partial [Sulfuricurvum sp.]